MRLATEFWKNLVRDKGWVNSLPQQVKTGVSVDYKYFSTHVYLYNTLHTTQWIQSGLQHTEENKEQKKEGTTEAKKKD